MRLLPLSIFVVRGRSMIPDYKPGDYVVTLNWFNLANDDVIVFRLGGKNYLKRVKKIQKNLVYVDGDNRSESSRVGPVKRSDIIGRVVLLY